MSYNPRLIRCLAPIGLLLAAPGCTERVRISPLFPPAQDLKAATEPKPVPPVEILTSSQASDRYDVDLELWGERVQRAGVRICRWAKDNGMPNAPC